jgi:hypothetical protein
MTTEETTRPAGDGPKTIPSVKVRAAFSMWHPRAPGRRIMFYNVIEEGHPLGYQSSLCRETIEAKGYRMEVVS